MSAPSFILSPTSLAEFPSYWGEPAQEFADIGLDFDSVPFTSYMFGAEDKSLQKALLKEMPGKSEHEKVENLKEAGRTLAVLRWYISTLKGQFTRREALTGSEKKPLNPILGEQFIGTYANGDLELIAEQVSHHPPMTAYYLNHPKAGVSLQGHCAQKTSFSGKAILVKQVGHAIVRVTRPNKDVFAYLLTLPKLRIDGILYGSPYVELTEQSYIQSSSGWMVSIEYKGKGYFSGKAHTYRATLHPPQHLLSTSTNNITIEGQWSGGSSSTYVSPSPKALIGKTFVDADREREVIKVKPIEEQGDLESRKVWKGVAEGIRSGDLEKTSREKAKVENEQRAKRKDEIANDSPWAMKYFKKITDDEDYRLLAAEAAFQPAQEEGYYFVNQV